MRKTLAMIMSAACVLAFSVIVTAQEPIQEGTPPQDVPVPAPQLEVPPIAQNQPQVPVDTRRKALEMLVEAELALDAGQRSRAITIANEAKRLYPESRAIGAFLQAIQAVTTQLRPATPSTHTQAKAHLAAALSRAQILMEQRRFTESLDMLNGVVEASKRFPPGSDIGIYRELARKQLAEYRAGVESGRIRPSDEASPIVSDQNLVPRKLDFPEAPANAYRLAQMAKDQAPPWYTRSKTSLRRKMSVDYRVMPLGLVLEEIEEKTGVPITVDAPLQAARTTLTAVIDLRISSVPAETILSLACEVAGCEYVILDKGVIVTTRDKAGDYLRNVVASVANSWAQARFLFPDLYVDAIGRRPLPEAAGTGARENDVPSYLRSGSELVSDIERLIE